MGGNKSKPKATPTNENNQTIVNKNEIEILNTNIQNTISNTTINNSSNAIVTSRQRNKIKYHNCTFKGDVTIDPIFQTNENSIDFSSVQASEIENDIANSILSDIMQNIDSKLDSESINRMSAYAETQAKTGFLGSGNAGGESNAHNYSNVNVTNENTQRLQNHIENTINVNFDASDVQDCITQIDQENEIAWSGCTFEGGYNQLPIVQSNANNLLVSCIQSKGISNNIMTDLANTFGVITDAGTVSKVLMDQDASATSTATTEGIGDAVPNPMGELLDSLNNSPPPGGGNRDDGNKNDDSSTTMYIIGSIILSFLCVVMLVLFGFYWYQTSGVKKSKK